MQNHISHYQSPRTKIPVFTVSLLLIGYFIFQCMFIPYSKLSVDEFWFAHHIYQYTQHMPYRDFPPYKTVLGYYLLMIPYFFSHAVLTPLYGIKIEIAFFNTLILLVVYRWMARLFQPSAVLWALLLIAANQLFLVYSVDLRVDMLASWFCLFAVLWVMDESPWRGGLCLSIGFLISQKALWYFAATNVALCVYTLCLSRNWKSVKQLCCFNLAALLGMTLYVLFWSAQSNFHEVMRSVFYEAYLQSKITWFASHSYVFWQEMLTNGPILYFLWPLTWLALCIPTPMVSKTYSRLFLATFSLVMMIFILTYKQSFPYNMVFSVPLFFVLYADFFSWLRNSVQNDVALFTWQRKLLFWVMVCYTIGLCGIIIIFDLPLGYFTISAIPVFLYYLLTGKQSDRQKSMLFTCILTLIVITGIFYPLVRFAMVSTLLNANYQRAMLLTANTLLGKEDDYVAGIQLFYNKNQPIPGLKNLIGPAIEYLETGDKKLESILLPSLDMSVTSPTQVIAALQAHPVKLMMDGGRITSLPPILLDYLYSHYARYWGAIYLYAPIVKPEEKSIQLPFAGKYQIISYGNTDFQIDNHHLRTGDTIHLSKGMHTLQTDSRLRLQWLPENDLFLNPEFANDSWERMMKFIVL